MAVRIRLDNSDSEILPGALLEITIKYNERNSLSIPDTSVLLEGNKVYIYKVNILEKFLFEEGPSPSKTVSIIFWWVM